MASRATCQAMAKDTRVRDSIAYEDTFVVNNFFKRWRHKSNYVEKVLRRLLEKGGFVNVTMFASNESEDEELEELASESRMPDRFLDTTTVPIKGTKPIGWWTPGNAPMHGSSTT